MALAVALQLDHPSKLNVGFDTSLMLAHEAQRRGHRCFFYEPLQLSWRAGTVSAPVRSLTLDFAATPSWSIGPAEAVDLATFDVVLMRQDPPFDMQYITLTHLLEQIQSRVLVVNDPAGVRNAPEKLSILGLQQFMPPTLISIDPGAIAQFTQEYGVVVAKPLYGFGGGGVFKLAATDPNLSTLIEHWQAQSREPLMWQAFLPEVAQGDKRILMIDGEVASSFGRAPGTHSIRANMRVGGTPKADEVLSPRQQQIVEALRPFLKQNGLLLAGVDVIGDYLTEINVTSPTGLRAAEALYGHNLAARFWDVVEAKLHGRV